MQTTFEDKVDNSHTEILESVNEQQRWIYGIFAGVVLSFVVMLALVVHLWRKLKVLRPADVTPVNGYAVHPHPAVTVPQRTRAHRQDLHYSLL